MHQGVRRPGPAGAHAASGPHPALCLPVPVHRPGQPEPERPRACPPVPLPDQPSLPAAPLRVALSHRLADSSPTAPPSLPVLQGKPLHPRLKGHTSAVVCLAFNPQGNLLASGGQDERLVVWDVRQGAPPPPPAPSSPSPAERARADPPLPPRSQALPTTRLTPTRTPSRPSASTATARSSSAAAGTASCAPPSSPLTLSPRARPSLTPRSAPPRQSPMGHRHWPMSQDACPRALDPARLDRLHPQRPPPPLDDARLDEQAVDVPAGQSRKDVFARRGVGEREGWMSDGGHGESEVAFLFLLGRGRRGRRGQGGRGVVGGRDRGGPRRRLGAPVAPARARPRKDPRRCVPLSSLPSCLPACLPSLPSSLPAFDSLTPSPLPWPDAKKDSVVSVAAHPTEPLLATASVSTDYTIKVFALPRPSGAGAATTTAGEGETVVGAGGEGGVGGSAAVADVGASGEGAGGGEGQGGSTAAADAAGSADEPPAPALASTPVSAPAPTAAGGALPDGDGAGGAEGERMDVDLLHAP